MREQVITPRAGRAQGRGEKGRGAGGGRAARRGDAAGGSTWRRVLPYVPLLLKVSLAACVGFVLFVGYRAASSASFFQLSAVEVDGAARASKDDIKAIVRRHVGGAGVWQADLAAISAELKSQPWVRAAVVSRVLPSGIRVKISEREPRLVSRTSAGRFVWVDDDGVTLGTALPTDHMPPFFIRGLDDAPTDSARAENRERIRKALEMKAEWETAGLASRVSEVTLQDLRDVRVQLSGEDSQIEVRLGREDFGKRLSRALKVLDDVRHSPRGTVVRLDATQEKRVIVGFGSSAQSLGVSADQPRPGSDDAQASAGDVDAASARDSNTSATNETAAASNSDNKSSGAGARKQSAASDGAARARRQEAKSARAEKVARKEKAEEKPARPAQLTERPHTAGAERPRRVG